MNSLKSIIPLLSDILGLSEPALYERQRALVRAGLLKVTPGRGPGSGVKATPETVAMLLISVLATDNLSDVAVMTGALAKASRVDGFGSEEVMPEVRTFKAALVRGLSSDDEKDHIHVALVYRYDQQAEVWPSVGKIDFGKPSTRKNSGVVRVSAQISGGGFDEIRRILKRIEPPSPLERQALLRRLARLKADEDHLP